MSDEVRWLDVFEHHHCEDTTRAGSICKMAPVWVDKKTGMRLCDAHATKRFEVLTISQNDAILAS